MTAKDQIRAAFQAWRDFITLNRDNQERGLVVNAELSTLFQAVALRSDLMEVFATGRSYGFAPVSIINMVALHGGYFRLLQAGVLRRGDCRFLDSLYHSTFPELTYNTQNTDILAPWITLGAQEALLDIGLSKYMVVEYGSGMSTFFFSQEAITCYSFEDDKDPAGKGSWTQLMQKQASRIESPINLVKPCMGNDTPLRIAEDIWKYSRNLLVSIDGGDRCRHLREWSNFIIDNKKMPIIILIDNSEIAEFRTSFESLAEQGASIYHHYGNVYGQLTTKQCTSFVTFRPKLMHGSGSAAPFKHDTRWGKMNMQNG